MSDPAARRPRLRGYTARQWGAAAGRASRRRIGAALPTLSLTVCLALSAGCATSGTRARGETPGDRSSINREELADVPGTNLYDVLLRVRPLWLITDGARARSVNVRTETVVLTDGRYFGGIESLRQLPVAGVRRIRYLTGSEAANAYTGFLMGRHVDAAIVVDFGDADPPMASE